MVGEESQGRGVGKEEGGRVNSRGGIDKAAST